MRVHPFHAGDHATHDGQRICEFCGAVEADKVHDMPELGDEQRRVEARRVGELVE